jgi:hypothetical protein
VFIVCALAGYLKDSLSGGVFGVYLSTYLWFFVLIRVSSMYLNINNQIFITFFGIAGVFINGFFIFVSNLKWFSDSEFSEKIFNSFLSEIVYCFFTFMILYYLFIRIREVGLSIKAGINNSLAQLSRI